MTGQESSIGLDFRDGMTQAESGDLRPSNTSHSPRDNYLNSGKSRSVSSHSKLSCSLFLLVSILCVLSKYLYLPLALRILQSMGPTPAKRKAQAGNSSNGNGESSSPEASPDPDTLRQPHPYHKEAEENGIVLREYYPHEMSNDRARAYRNGDITRPIEQLNAALAATAKERKKTRVAQAVVHWFKMDLRTADNRALYCAGEKAKEAGVPLLTMYLVSPQDWEAHLTAPVRVDFMLRTLKILKEDLAKLDIPLYVETVETRQEIPTRIVELMDGWGASHLFANMEYEVDELRREAKLAHILSDSGKALEIMHDTCVVPPGQLSSGTGKQYAVYSPWFKSWTAHIHDNPELLELVGTPPRNPVSARNDFKQLFDAEIPDAPGAKRLTKDEADRYKELWPAGEHEAMSRLEVFCQEKISQYAARRNLPAETGTSSLSVHFASGTLSARTAVRVARDMNRTRKLNAGNEGIQTWISEVAWRDFYRHVLVNWPYVWYVSSRLCSGGD